MVGPAGLRPDLGDFLSGPGEQALDGRVNQTKGNPICSCRMSETGHHSTVVIPSPQTAFA